MILVNLLLIIIFYAYNFKFVKVRYIVILFISLILFGILRSSSIDNMNLEEGLLEFLFTYSSSFLFLESSFSADIQLALLHSLGKIFIINPLELFGIKFTSYRDIIETLNPNRSTMGLGGRVS